jgi:hypothetical protein
MSIASAHSRRKVTLASSRPRRWWKPMTRSSANVGTPSV